MTFTFDAEKYGSLLSQHQLKVIKTEEENEELLEVVEALMHKQSRTPEETELYQLFVTLIEQFEQEHYSPGRNSTPHSMLQFLMEQQNVQTSDLVSLLGSEEIATAIVDGKYQITLSQAEQLGCFFKVDPFLFICINS
jgi:HTH-type transcriptional regulator/antitoxin HigA